MYFNLFAFTLFSIVVSSRSSKTNDNINCNNWLLGAGLDGYNRYIQFSSNNTYYQIDTEYYIWYPDTIRNNLKEIPDISVFDSYEVANLPNCGWFQISNAYKYSLNTFKIDVLINQNTGLADYNLALISKIQKILDNTYPTGEIIFAVLFIPVLILVLITLLFIYLLVREIKYKFNL